MYIIYINIMYIVYHLSRVNTQEKNAYQELREKTPTTLSFRSWFRNQYAGEKLLFIQQLIRIPKTPTKLLQSKFYSFSLRRQGKSFVFTLWSLWIWKMYRMKALFPSIIEEKRKSSWTISSLTHFETLKPSRTPETLAHVRLLLVFTAPNFCFCSKRCST